MAREKIAGAAGLVLIFASGFIAFAEGGTTIGPEGGGHRGIQGGGVVLGPEAGTVDREAGSDDVLVLLSFQVAVGDHGPRSLRGTTAVTRLMALARSQDAWVAEEALRLLRSIAGRTLAGIAEAESWWGEVCAARAEVSRVLAKGELRPGVLVQYYPNLALEGPPACVELRPEPRLDDHDAPQTGVPQDFSSRWVTRLEVPREGEHAFSLWIDDGARIWIDGKLVFDEWAFRHEWRGFGPIHLAKGHHDVVLEHFDSAGYAGIYIAWKTPGAAGFEAIPFELFHVPEGLKEAVVRLQAAHAPSPAAARAPETQLRLFEP
jgi:hypothetical protein